MQGTGNMTEWDFLQWIVKSINGPEFGNRFLLVMLIVIIVLTFIQVSKIPWDPWSRLASAIGRALNRESIEENKRNFDRLSKRMDLIEQNQEEEREARLLNEAVTSRVRILRFQSELLKGERHTLSEFNQALDDIDHYENYCKENPNFPNSKAVEAAGNIKRCYRKAEEERDFLPEVSN